MKTFGSADGRFSGGINWRHGGCQEKEKRIPLIWIVNVRSGVLPCSYLSFPLDEIGNELWDIRTGEKGSWKRGVAAEHFSDGKGGLDDEAADALEEEDHDGHLCENTSVFESPCLRFFEDAEIFLGGRVGSFRGGAEGLQLLMPVCSAEHLNDQPGEVADRHMASESLVVDPVFAVFGVLPDLRIV